MERIKGEITERFEDENNKMQGVVEALDEFTIPKIEIAAGMFLFFASVSSYSFLVSSFSDSRPEGENCEIFDQHEARKDDHVSRQYV